MTDDELLTPKPTVANEQRQAGLSQELAQAQQEVAEALAAISDSKGVEVVNASLQRSHARLQQVLAATGDRNCAPARTQVRERRCAPPRRAVANKVDGKDKADGKDTPEADAKAAPKPAKVIN